MNNNVEYLLGIDGGGTKTEFLLTRLNGDEIKRTVSVGSNPVNGGIENTLAVLGEGIAEICSGFEFGKISVFAGIAGANTGDNQRLINDFLSHFAFASFDCGSDTDLVLEVALKGGNGTAVIMGTGIVAYSRSEAGLRRTGGRGYMIDRGGSGFHFGSDALNCAFEFIDGRGGSEIILRLCEKRLGKSLEDSVAEIYGGGAAFVASFAPVVFEAFALGDSAANEIIDRNILEASKIINGARQNTDDKIVICGGLCKQKEILYPFLMKYTEGNTSPVFSDEPTVNGAIALARRGAL